MIHRWGFSSFLPSHTPCGSASRRELLPVDNEEHTTQVRPTHGTLTLMWWLFCFVPKEEERISVKFETIWKGAYTNICFLPFHSARSPNRKCTQNIVPLYLLISQSPHIHVPRDTRTRLMNCGIMSKSTGGARSIKGAWCRDRCVVSLCIEQLIQLELKRQIEKFYGYVLRVRVGYSWPWGLGCRLLDIC